MSELINRLNKISGINTGGWKEIELEFLQQALIPGAVLIVGEKDGCEGITQIVLENDDIEKPVVCLDIENIVGNSYLTKKVESGEVKFIHENLINYYPERKDFKFENIVCINVLEHFGVENNEISKMDYDRRGLQKMFDLCGDQIILTVPYTMFEGFDLHVDGGRHYTQTRINLLKSECGKNQFEIEFEGTMIDVNKSNNYRNITDEQLEEIGKEYTKHDFLKLFVIKRIQD